jgi:hypothetical protein
MISFANTKVSIVSIIVIVEYYEVQKIALIRQFFCSCTTKAIVSKQGKFLCLILTVELPPNLKFNGVITCFGYGLIVLII